MVREKKWRKCCVKSTKAPGKMRKEGKREGKPTKKIFDAPRTMAEEEPEVDTKGWAPDPRPYFYKILHPDQSTERMRIPPAFIKHLRNDMSNRATLKCSSGRFWNIELRPAIGSVYLQDGWQQFLQDNSLGDREFLLFRYDGNMCFNVQIFEKSGCERLDMSVTEKDKESAVPEVKRKRGRPRKNPLVPSPLNSSGDSPVKEGKGILRKIKDEDKIDLSFQEVDLELKESKGDKNFLRKTRTGLTLSILKKDSHMTPERSPPAEEVEEEDTIGFAREAESFSSDFPYFQISMKRSSVDKVYIMHIPSSFAKAHLQNIKTSISLRNQKGETWEVNCIPTGRDHYLCGGWAAFVRGNHLKGGDICIFELVSQNEMQVHIFRM